MSRAGRLSDMPTLERVMRFVLWAEQLQTPPRWEDVMVRFEVCRATAYRLIGTWRDSKGLPRLSSRRKAA